MGKTGCIQVNAAGFEQSTKCSRARIANALVTPYLPTTSLPPPAPQTPLREHPLPLCTIKDPSSELD